MRIVLVSQNSSYTHTNLAVRYIRNRLVQAGHEVYIAETTVNEKSGILPLLEMLYNYNADVYGFSTYIWNLSEQITAAQEIKKLLPNCKIAFGGPEVSYEEEDFFEKYPFVDYLLKGEGEESFCKLCEKLPSSHIIIDGGEYEDFENQSEPYLCDEFSNERTEDLSGKLIYYESSRGCPFSCSYCLSSVNGKRVRAKSAKLVLSELSVLMDSGAKVIKFVDRTFNYDKVRTKEIFSKLIEISMSRIIGGRYIGAKLHFEICASLLDDETVEILSKAPENLIQFEIGIQSTDKDVLCEISRKDNIEKSLDNIKLLRQNTNIPLHLDLICGLPHDTFQKIRKSFDDIYLLSDNLQLGFLKLLKGTALLRDAEKYGMIYLSKPPYRILCMDKISFAEMNMLSGVEKALDRFSGQAFKKSIKFIAEKSESPFDFYLSLSFKDEIFSLSKKSLYTFLFNFSMNYLQIKKKSFDERLLRDFLLFDFLISNQGKPPNEIKIDDDTFDKRETVKMFISNMKDKKRDNFFIAALEAYRFSFDNDFIYIIDRKNGCYEKMPVFD